MFGEIRATTSKDIGDQIKMGLLAVTQELRSATKEDIEECLEELIKEKMPVGMLTGVKVEVVENIVHVTVNMPSHAERFEVQTNILLTDVVKIEHDPDFLKDLKDL